MAPPFGRGDQCPRRPATTRSHGSGKGARMLAVVADDDGYTALMLSRTVEKWDFEVTVAHDGTSALDAIIKGPTPSVAILDWMMPGIDGIELCRRIRQAS